MLIVSPRAVELAHHFNVSNVIIGLTIVGSHLLMRSLSLGLRV